MNIFRLAFIIALVNLTVLSGVVILGRIVVSTPTGGGENKSEQKTLSRQNIPTQDKRCLITVDDQKYDVTLFRNMHQGGDVFECGGDMSEEFRQQHTQKYLGLMEKFKVR